MYKFRVNGQTWTLIFVHPNSRYLVDRTHRLTLGTTDPVSRTVYLSSGLSTAMTYKVLLHELSHCVLISFGLIKQIHDIVKKDYWFYAEEQLCNFLSNYSTLIFQTANRILQNELSGGY